MLPNLLRSCFDEKVDTSEILPLASKDFGASDDSTHNIYKSNDDMDDVDDIKFDDKSEYKISSPNLHAKRPCGDCGACWAFSDAKQLNVLTVQQRIEAIKEVLRVEKDLNENTEKIENVTARPPSPKQPVNSLSSGWQLLSIIIDSGAAETVIPHKLIQGYKIQETKDSREGLCYASATGDPIPNLGEQVLPLETAEGTWRSMRFQAAPVERPLGSVKRICQAGHRVVFDEEEGSYILNKNTGEINWLREDNGNYVMDTWVLPPQGLLADPPRSLQQDFHGPP